MRRLSLLLFVLAAACQPLPHPFADDRPPPRSPVLSPRDSAGVMIEPIAGAPTPIASDLAEAMAAALRAAEIPASTQGRNRGSFELASAAHMQALANGNAAIAIDWELRGPDGRIVGRVSTHAEQKTAAWQAGGNAVAASIVTPAAPAIAKLIQDDPPRAAADADVVVALYPVTGAPGDGGRSLTRAMGEALRRANVALAEKPADHETFVLAGTVLMSRPQSGKQQVKVNWTLLRPDGSQIGEVNQENAVPAGSLDHVWGDVAYAVASAAVPGITALIERAQAAAAERS